jgi:hypothetical protein
VRGGTGTLMDRMNQSSSRERWLERRTFGTRNPENILLSSVMEAAFPAIVLTHTVRVHNIITTKRTHKTNTWLRHNRCSLLRRSEIKGPSTTMNLWRSPGKAHHRQRSRFYVWFLLLSLVLAVATIWQSSRLLPPADDPPSLSLWVPSRRKVSKDLTTSISTTTILGDTTERAIFYNIFVPNDDKNKQNALSIVQQQLSKKRSTPLIAQAPVYYTLIGNPNATEDIQRICAVKNDNNHGHNNNHNNGKCHQLRNVEQGDEGLTLQSLWEYCQTQNHTDHLVTYIHDKGSFHPSEPNDKLRIMLTKAVFSNECQTINNNNKCNICAARFSAIPHYHMAGNMWTAKCRYVKHLIAPDRFASRMDDLVDYVLSHANDTDTNTTTSIPQPTPFQIRLQFPLGLKRFSHEHWLGSHPSLQPCDVYPNPNYQNGYTNLPHPVYDKWKPRLQAAPWRSPQVGSTTTSFAKGDWFCGRARLVEFAFLYDNMRPPPDSFVWEYYGNATKDCPRPILPSFHS